MSETPFRRVVLICDPACDIRLAVADAASLAARWGAVLHGIYLDDENLRRFAALPFGQHASLSSPDVIEELSSEAMAQLSSAMEAGMKRLLADVAAAQGLEWTFGSIRDLPSAASIETEEGDILVVEAAPRAFSGAWRPRTAWQKSPASFSGTVLLKGRGRSKRGILALLPEDPAAREHVLAAVAALAHNHDKIVLAGTEKTPSTTAAEIERHFAAAMRKRIKTVPIENTYAAMAHHFGRTGPALIVVHAEDAPDWLDDSAADILLVR